MKFTGGLFLLFISLIEVLSESVLLVPEWLITNKDFRRMVYLHTALGSDYAKERYERKNNIAGTFNNYLIAETFKKSLGDPKKNIAITLIRALSTLPFNGLLRHKNDMSEFKKAYNSSVNPGSLTDEDYTAQTSYCRQLMDRLLAYPDLLDPFLELISVKSNGKECLSTRNITGVLLSLKESIVQVKNTMSNITSLRYPVKPEIPPFDIARTPEDYDSLLQSNACLAIHSFICERKVVLQSKTLKRLVLNEGVNDNYNDNVDDDDSIETFNLEGSLDSVSDFISKETHSLLQLRSRILRHKNIKINLTEPLRNLSLADDYPFLSQSSYRLFPLLLLGGHERDDLRGVNKTLLSFYQSLTMKSENVSDKWCKDLINASSGQDEFRFIVSEILKFLYILGQDEFIKNITIGGADNFARLPCIPLEISILFLENPSLVSSSYFLNSSLNEAVVLVNNSRETHELKKLDSLSFNCSSMNDNDLENRIRTLMKESRWAEVRHLVDQCRYWREGQDDDFDENFIKRRFSSKDGEGAIFFRSFHLGDETLQRIGGIISSRYVSRPDTFGFDSLKGLPNKMSVSTGIDARFERSKLFGIYRKLFGRAAENSHLVVYRKATDNPYSDPIGGKHVNMTYVGHRLRYMEKKKYDFGGGSFWDFHVDLMKTCKFHTLNDSQITPFIGEIQKLVGFPPFSKQEAIMQKLYTDAKALETAGSRISDILEAFVGVEQGNYEDFIRLLTGLYIARMDFVIKKLYSSCKFPLPIIFPFVQDSNWALEKFSKCDNDETFDDASNAAASNDTFLHVNNVSNSKFQHLLENLILNLILPRFYYGPGWMYNNWKGINLIFRFFYKPLSHDSNLKRELFYFLKISIGSESSFYQSPFFYEDEGKEGEGKGEGKDEDKDEDEGQDEDEDEDEKNKITSCINNNLPILYLSRKVNPNCRISATDMKAVSKENEPNPTHFEGSVIEDNNNNNINGITFGDAEYKNKNNELEKSVFVDDNFYYDDKDEDDEDDERELPKDVIVFLVCAGLSLIVSGFLYYRNRWYKQQQSLVFSL